MIETPRPDEIVAPAATAPSPTQSVPPAGAAARPGGDDDLPRVGPLYIWFQVLGQFGVFMAFITPLAISLTIRVEALAPGHPEVLGYVTGAGALWVMLTSLFMGIWSDRTRSRLGRRRPFMIGGMLIGIVSLIVMALAPNVIILGLGWILAQWGWGTTLSNLQISTVDRLPASQRGKVAGLASFATQVAPVFGVVIAQFFTGDPLLLFLIPGSVGVLFVTLFVTLVHEDDARELPREDITVGQLLKKYLYNPVQHPDFSLNWLSRLLFYFGLTLNTTYTAFFLANRLGVTVEEVAGVVGILSIGGVLAVTLVAVDYRRVPPWSWFRDPPERDLPGTRYPIPGDDVEDVFTAIRGRRDAVALGGASAGACLPAPSPALRARVRGRHSLIQFRSATVRRTNRNYAGSARAREHAFPGGQDLSGLPQTLVLDADRDTLRASGDAFAAELARAGVHVTHRMVPESTHGFLDRPGTRAFDAGIAAMTEMLLTVKGRR